MNYATLKILARIRAKLRTLPPLHNLLKRVFIQGAIPIALVGGVLAVYLVILTLPELPTSTEIRQATLNIPLRIYNNEEQLIAEYGNERRIPVPLDEVPALLIDAILATEDDGFYHHNGVDFLGLVHAGWKNLTSDARPQGASTITMQVARNFFLTPEQTYTRKFKEILLSFHMERALTKDEILELYLNKIFLGHRAYGFASASKVYYGTELKNLTLPQLAMLAGLPKAPSRNNPLSNPKRASERRNYVLKRMFQLGRIDKEAYQAAIAAPVSAARQSGRNSALAPFAAEMARQWMVEHFGEIAYEKGYRVTLTINSDYQAQASKALRKGLLDYDLRHGYRGVVANITDLDSHASEALKSLESLAPLKLADSLEAVEMVEMVEAVDAVDEVLREYPTSQELIPALVLENEEKTITARSRERKTINISWDNIKWARPYINPNKRGRRPRNSSEVVKPGDIIYVLQTNKGEWRLTQLPEISGALVSLDVNNGAILALIGGFDYYLSKFNRATSAVRQPGSNIKPFIYSAALDNGFTASSLVSANPVVVNDVAEGAWRPENYSKKFFGPTRLRNALSRSLNLVSVRLVRALGINKTIEYMAKFGFDSAKMPRTLSIALGSIGITPLELARGFAVFANEGERVKPYLIDSVVDKDGKDMMVDIAGCEYCRVVEKPQEKEEEVDAPAEFDQAEENRVISPQTAFLISDMMNQVIRSGTGRRALSLNRLDLSGKTGTTNNFRDAWFSGFNQDIVTTVYVGFDEPSHLGKRESGASAALPIWIDYMRPVLKDFPKRIATPPENISTRFINKTTAKTTHQDDPDGYFEYYIVGTEPDGETATRLSKQHSDGERSATESLF